MIPPAPTRNTISLMSGFHSDPAILQDIAQWKEPMRNISMTHVGTTLVFLQGSRTVCRLKECNMGEFEQWGSTIKHKG